MGLLHISFVYQDKFNIFHDLITPHVLIISPSLIYQHFSKHFTSVFHLKKVFHQSNHPEMLLEFPKLVDEHVFKYFNCALHLMKVYFKILSNHQETQLESLNY